MDLHLELTRNDGAPLRRQLERQLRGAIRAGRLAGGSALPPSRVLAEELGVSRGVVVDCYAQLNAEGYLSARQGAGTHVAYLPSPPTPLGSPPRVGGPKIRYDLRPGQADFHSFPRRRWQAALGRALRELPDIQLTYAGARGIGQLRRGVADYVGRVRAVAAEADNVVICCSLAHGLSTLWHALREQGARRVAVEDPGWRWQTRTVEHAGLEAVPVPVDADGLVVAELERLELDAVVLTPAHQYPTGVVLSPARRGELIAWARRRRALIVEDDYDAEYRFDREPVAALQGLAPDVVVFCATTSKTLAPALRLAWMVLPARLVDGVANQLTVTGAMPPVLEQAAAAAFIADAELDRHLRQMRRHYRTKRNVLLAELEKHLPEARVSGAAAGLHLLAWLPEALDESSVAAAARRAGIAVHELHRHCTVSAPLPPALLLGYALPSAVEIRVAMRMLAAAIE